MRNIVFMCEFCNREFDTKNACNSHRGKCKQNPNYKYKEVPYEVRKHHSDVMKGKVSEPFVNCKCSFCNRNFTRKSAKTIHEKYCKQNENRVVYIQHLQSEETKRKISEGMRKAHNEKRAGTFPTRKNCEHSWPEKWLINVLKRELGFIECKDYQTEFYFYKQFLDFAWVEKKLCIEIDGEQHNRFQDRIDADKRKDENLKKEGWKLLRINWSYVCNNTQDSIKQIVDFLK